MTETSINGENGGKRRARSRKGKEARTNRLYHTLNLIYRVNLILEN